ncbi:MAG: CPBP family glutamic-type intramembrane protease [Planctomycetota bacterium]
MSGAGRTAWPAPPAWGAVLVAEAALVTAAILAYTHLALPSHRVPGWVGPVFFVGIFVVPIALARWHGDGTRAMGVRVDNLGASLRAVAPVALLLLGIVAAVGLAMGTWHLDAPDRVMKRVARYLLYGPVQQLLLCGFLFRRLHQALGGALPAALVAGLFFGAAHAPNLPLMGMTTVVGVVSCWIFARVPNVLAVGWLLGLSAVVVRYAWPETWLERLTVGGNYLERITPGLFGAG